MDTNMDAMSSTLLHMRQELTHSHRQITLLNEENARLKTLSQSTTNSINTPNGTTHTDSSIVSTTTNNKSSQKRPHPSNRTTQNVATTNKLKTATNLYDVDETSLPTGSNEMMDVESITLTNSTNNQHLKRTSPLENGINITP
jgi:hypothetical protein